MATHLLSGAGSGIGAVLAARLRERGDDLVLIARTEARAAQLLEEHPGARAVVADLARPEGLDALVLPDRLDSLVHAAGVVELGPLAELSTAAWTEQVAVNLVAPAVLTRQALPALRAGRGTVVMLNSGAGLFAHPQWSAYAATKHGLKALADALRAEEAAHGVRVTSVFPGRTATPMQAEVHRQEGRDYEQGRWIRPETVVDAILAAIDLPPDATMPDITLKPR